MKLNLVRAAVLSVAAACAANHAAAVVIFINDTGAPVTDFHYTVQVIRGSFTAPDSVPWGAGTAVDNGTGFDVSYAGSPIAPSGTLTLVGITLTQLTQGTSQLYADFTWTPGGQTTLPVPEPTTTSLLMVGALGLAAAGAWRARRG